MKKVVLLLVCACCLYTAAFAQEEKPESSKGASPELLALQTATSLAKYGYAHFSATALVEAAKIFSETKTQSLEVSVEREKSEITEAKNNPVSFDPIQLFSDAKKFAGKDKVLLAYINQIEKNAKSQITRGAVGGPKGTKDRVLAKDVDKYTVKFWSNELAEVCVSGDGDTDLDLYIYDENGNLIGSDTDYSDDCVVRWVPKWTGNFTIRIVNRGIVYNNYALWTN